MLSIRTIEMMPRVKVLNYQHVYLKVKIFFYFFRLCNCCRAKDFGCFYRLGGIASPDQVWRDWHEN